MAVDSVAELPLVPRSPLSVRAQIAAVKKIHTSSVVLRDAGGPLSRFSVVPGWLMPPAIFVSSPDLARLVLSSSTLGVIDKTSPLYVEMRRIVGDDLFNRPDEQWQPFRRTIQPSFTKHRVREYDTSVTTAVDAVVGGWRDGDVVDLDASCRRLTLGVLGEAVLGGTLGDRATELGPHMHLMLQYVSRRATAPVRPPRWLRTPGRRRAQRSARLVRDAAADVIRRCREDANLIAPLVRSLLDAVDPDTGHELTDAQVADELVAMMVAGHDTTATTLAYSLWALGHHPDTQERVRAEARSVEGDLRATDLAHLRFTTQVIHEALRLCPPATSLVRTATDDIAAAGYRIAKGSTIVVGIPALHMDPDAWERPLEFDPERFAPERMSSIDRWQYMPFGAGRRSCIGDHFAMQEAVIALASIVRGVDVESVSDDFPLTTPFTTVAAEPILARVTRLRG